MTNICKYYKHPKGCTCKDPFKCLEQLCSNPMICTSNLYYAMGLEQECEELKNKIKKLRKNLALEIEINDCYRKALEEIEEIANETCIDSQSDCKSCNFSCEHKDILDIINKAKGTDNGLS